MTMRRGTTIFLAVATAGLTACGKQGPSDMGAGAGAVPDRAGSEEARPATIRLESAAFKEGEMIPRVHTCDGAGTSPPLSWSGVPEGARSLALIVEDPDAPGGTFTHWVLFGLPPDLGGLEAGRPTEGEIELTPGGKTARQGKNDFGKLGYGGPCPPRGTHRYVFVLHALDAPPALEPGATKEELLRAIDGHTLAEGRLMGRYAR